MWDLVKEVLEMLSEEAARQVTFADLISAIVLMTGIQILIALAF